MQSLQVSTCLYFASLISFNQLQRQTQNVVPVIGKTTKKCRTDEGCCVSLAMQNVFKCNKLPFFAWWWCGGVVFNSYWIDTKFAYPTTTITWMHSNSARKIIPYQFGTVVHFIVEHTTTTHTGGFFCANSSNFSQYNGFNETVFWRVLNNTHTN